MKKGRLTIPTDRDFVEGTKKYVERWGADAVRDCDGTELPDNVAELADKVYKTYFLVRGDNEYAYAHDEYLQNIALITERFTAISDVLDIDLMKGFFAEQVRVNPFEHKKYWQVFDRTTGEEVPAFNWEYLGNNIVRITSAKKFHEYTVNFFGQNLWDATQVYNYTCNGWTKTKDRDIDPIYPEAFEHIMQNLETWLKENPQVSVVRFTTFFYHFFLLYLKGDTNKLFDWYNYAMSASPAMFEKFKAEYGYDITLEDLLTEGSYGNHFHLPNKARADYYDMVQRFVAEKMKIVVDKVHEYGKEAMMFWGDSWVGAEPYGKYFPQIGLDAVVGSASSGCTTRAVSDLTSVKCKEIRLNPYFFPDTLAEDETSTKALLKNWVIERRAIMRKPVDRIGYGGYLAIADKFPKFCQAVEDIANEFRTIYDTVDNQLPYCPIKVAILDYYGKEKSWETYMMCQDTPYQQTGAILGVLECLSGLPVDIHFVSFEDAKAGKLKEYDVVINGGPAGTAFSGSECWKDEKLVESVREYIANGGGFIGVDEPTAVKHGGRFFQLADALGVDKEQGLSLPLFRYNVNEVTGHFIMKDASGALDTYTAENDVYALEGTQVLQVAGFKDVLNLGHIKASCNEYFGGRTCYFAGLRYNAENARTLYRALLWSAKKEDLLHKAFSSNYNVDCNYYPSSKKYALVNNTAEKQTTTFYDINGNATEYTLAPNELRWI